jgi:hypothetical protein
MPEPNVPLNEASVWASNIALVMFGGVRPNGRLIQDSAVPSSRRTRSCAAPANRRPSARQRNQLGRRPGSQHEGVGPFCMHLRLVPPG